MNITQLPLAFEILAEAEITPHVIGEAGVGKSQSVYQYAEKMGMDVVEVRVGLMADSGDLVGIQEFIRCENTQQPLSTRHVLPDWFMEAVVKIRKAGSENRQVVLFFDELTRGHKDLLQACFELVYDRALKGTKVRKGTFIVAASNPTTDDYAGSMEFSDDAFQDRFCHIKLEPTVEEFINYGKTRGKISNVILDFIGEYPQMLDKEHKPWTLDFVNPSRRSWDRLNKVLNIIEKKGGAYKDIELELMFGIVGEKAALAFTDFRNTYIKSIKAIDVLNSYSSNPMVRKSVAEAIEKGRTDMLGTLNEELFAELAKLDKLTREQADNLADLSHDLPVEHAYALVLKLTGSPSEMVGIRTIEGESGLGLWSHPKFVARVEHIKKQREEVKKQAKKKEAKK
jgi:hypothetical protein